jgi:hypothetical protein
LIYLAENYGNLQDKAVIKSTMVAKLLEAGLLIVASSNHYDTGDGKGQTFVFKFPGGARTRLRPEWHIHFQAAGGNNPAIAAGTGWKHKNEKFQRGRKVFDPTDGGLPRVLKAKDKWHPPTNLKASLDFFR